MKSLSRSLLICSLFATTVPAAAQIDARMLRYPDVSETHITFVYAGDIWVAPKDGGTASRLSSPAGEESFPRFSPDGSRIAFSGNYDGNTDVYVIPVAGGVPKRVTHHPMNDRLLGWHPNGDRVLFASSMESGRQRYRQFYLAPSMGGMPEKLPVPYGEFGMFSPDGVTFAYTPKSRDFRTWKRYRGGTAPDVWLFNLDSFESENITDHPANDSQPMWHRQTVYFMSDRGPHQRNNIWAYDLANKQARQITTFADFDIHFPSIGPSDIVFQAGSSLYVLDLNTESYSEVTIDVVTDRSTLKPRAENVADQIQNMSVSPTGKRALFEARGDIFSVPAEHGVVRNLTQSPGIAERYPAWSPDGEVVAYWSDRSGEYELTIRSTNGTGKEIVLTSPGPGYRYRPFWSPDSRKLAFVDQTMAIQIHDRDSQTTVKVDQGLFMYQGGLNAFRARWSADSRWLTYSRSLEHRNAAVFLFDTQSASRHRMTSGYYSDFSPTFDPDGKYLYFFSNRTLSPSYSDLDNTWIYPNTTNIVAVTLRKDVASPLEPRNDVENADEDADDDDDDDKKKDEEDEEVETVDIDLDRFEQRLVLLPVDAGNYTDLEAVSNKVLYRRLPRTGSGDTVSPALYFDLEEREEKTILDDADDYILSANNKKLLVRQNDMYAIVDVASTQKMEDGLRTAELEATVDPSSEWKQIFTDAWRFQRDFFYDKGMHGVDWDAMRVQYGALIENAVTRWDVNYVIGELIAELNASHTYRGGGDTESPERRGTGLLGVDWSVENDAYRIKRIVDGALWDNEIRSPLAMPGVDINEGDYVLAVNGIKLDTSKDPWAAFQGLSEKTVSLSVSATPSMADAREVLVETLGDETRLRHLQWIESNRKRVEEASGGRLGYVYVPNTGRQGQTELVRQFRAQFNKEGLIIDERFNSGGQIPDRFVELLDRKPLAFWSVRDGKDWQWPPVAHFGPKAMLINGWSGSGGDALPDYFRKAELGPLVGTRTWGGLIGITGAPRLIDGGVVTIPTFRMYNTDGSWFEEGHGVDPDIEVLEDPTQLARGLDPQIEKAVEEVLRLLNENPPPAPKRPPYEDRTTSPPTVVPPRG